VTGMPAITCAATASTPWPNARGGALSWPRAWIVVLTIATVAVVVRTSALATYGLSEDEVNKVRAIEQYRGGVCSANAEHPMLMKLAMWASLGAARVWNHVAPPNHSMSIETALRLPNAVAGAATTLALYGVADLLFGGATAFAVALIWTFDVN